MTLSNPLQQTNNLPIQLTSFIGRERVLAEVNRLLNPLSGNEGTGEGLGVGARLVTLTGVGGCGKTRLAIEVARDCCRDVALQRLYADGVWFVGLASLSDPALVPQVVAKVLDVPEQPNRALTETLADHLRAKQLLMVLDNCEHLIVACAQLAETLLQACLHLTILATSREALNITGEVAFHVPSLSTPPVVIGHFVLLLSEPTVLQALTQYEAVRLFVERAVAVQSSFKLTQENALAVMQVCQHLDGIPLAIELAAARLKALTVAEIAARLDDRFHLLTSGSRTLPRHQTLRATIDWSYDLLSEQERVLLRRLSVFAGGWTLEAAEQVTSDEWRASHVTGHEASSMSPVTSHLSPLDILDLLMHLVDKSLVVVDTQGSETRYRMLETIRQYAREKLVESSEEQRQRSRHLAFFAQLAEQAEPKLFDAEQVIWLNRLETELDNIRAALDWSVEGAEAVAGLRLAGALWWFWYTHGHDREGLARLSEVLAQPEAMERTTARGRALFAAGFIHLHMASYNEAQPLLEEALAIGREVDDRKSLAQVFSDLATLATRRADYQAAYSLLEEGLAIAREFGPPWTLAYTLARFGFLLVSQGEYDRAQSTYEEMVNVLRALKDKNMLAVPLRMLGHLAVRRHEYEKAIALCRESLALNAEIGDKRGVAASLSALAGVAVARSDFVHAAQLFGASEALLDAIHAQLDAASLDFAAYEQNLSSLRAQLDEPTFNAAWEAGRALTLEQAIAYALEPLMPREPVAHPLTARQAAKQEFGGLTAREREVVVLIAQGKTSREIAEALVLSERTVEGHVGNILNKLGFTSRAQIAAWVVEKRLVKGDAKMK